MSRVAIGQGRTAEAIQLLGNTPDALQNPENRGFLGYYYARAGRTEDAERLAAQSKYPNEQALIYAGLRDKERTFDALDRMQSLGAQRIGIHLSYPEIASLLRGDARLTPFRHKVGLPEVKR